MPATNKEIAEIVSNESMSQSERFKIYDALIKKGSEWDQVEMMIEEMAELIQAFNKLKRTKKFKESVLYPSQVGTIDYSLKYFSVCSEIADVEILLEQMKRIFNPEAIELSKQRKLQRQKKRVLNDKI